MTATLSGQTGVSAAGALTYLALAVRDVAASAAWYGAVADLVAEPGDAGDAGAEMALRLPSGYAGEGTRLLLRPGAPSGAELEAAGELLTISFTVVDIQETARRAKAIGATLIKGPDHRHLWLQDPTGYKVHLVGPAQPGAPVTPGWRYVGLRVDDLQAAQDYYVDRFGFEVLPEKTGSDGTAMARVAPADKRYARFSLQYYPTRSARPSVPAGLFAVGVEAAGANPGAVSDPAGYALEVAQASRT